MHRAQTRAKVRKIKHSHLPGLKGICVGRYLESLYARMSKDIAATKHDDHTKGMMHSVMHMTDVEISNWCRCPRCKEHVIKLLEFINKHKDQNGKEEADRPG